MTVCVNYVSRRTGGLEKKEQYKNISLDVSRRTGGLENHAM